MVCGFLSKTMHLGSHLRDHAPRPGGKTRHSLRDASQGMSSWHLCWGAGQTRMNQPDPVHRRGEINIGPHDPITNHHPQPTVAKNFPGGS